MTSATRLVEISVPKVGISGSKRYAPPMPLSQEVLDRIRDEIGPDLDVTDEVPVGTLVIDLETTFTIVDRGDFSVLRTAYLVWKRRLAAMQARSFDMTAGGSLMARSQRMRMIRVEMFRLELIVDFTQKGTNENVLSKFEQETTGTELA